MAGTDTARAGGGADGAAGRRGPEAAGTRADETTVPVLPCVSAEATLEFYRALGFEVTHEQTRPYLYLALRWSGFDLHYGRAPKELDPARENSGGCLVMVDAVAPYHAALTRAMRRAYGRVLAKGLPRLTRYRPGASRFTLMDPSGNSIIFIQRDEPGKPSTAVPGDSTGSPAYWTTHGPCATSRPTTPPPSGGSAPACAGTATPPPPRTGRWRWPC